MARSESHRHASKVGRAFGARTEKASAAVRLPSSHARAIASSRRQPDRIRSHATVTETRALAASHATQTPHTPTRTGQRRGKLDICQIVGAR